MGNHPCVFTEIGIPYDMDDKHAYKTGDFSSQVSAMDANHFALEGSGANGYSIWVYMTQVNNCALELSQMKLLMIRRIAISGATFGTGRISRSSLLMIYRLLRPSIKTSSFRIVRIPLRYQLTNPRPLSLKASRRIRLSCLQAI